MVKKDFLALLLAIGLGVGVYFAYQSWFAEPKDEQAKSEEKQDEQKEDEKPAEIVGKIILATTTSTENSGLLDYILPEFTSQTGIEVQVVAVGTGAALELGKNGDADVLLVHARAQEDAFVADGHGVDREDVMYNDFVVIGPIADPAGIKGLETVSKAFAKIADSGSTFVSRGDNSGTHVKELAIWEAAGVELEGSWYVESGQGMGETLNMADEMQAYTLTDRATYVAYRNDLQLPILLEGDEVLFNPYGVMAVSPDKYPDLNYAGATSLINWLISSEGQALIESFELDGETMFFGSR
ncbi:MAG TPA: tungsten ABC transporter substrate-binding protein [Candidatus Wirthbacteria bacterium]|nr:tungsten ABC transporter substrate-binding protein [Candidatus Wirthbacteria bacterium]